MRKDALMKAHGYRVRCFASAREMLASGLFRKPVDGDELLDAVKRVKLGVKR